MKRQKAKMGDETNQDETVKCVLSSLGKPGGTRSLILNERRRDTRWLPMSSQFSMHRHFLGAHATKYQSNATICRRCGECQEN